MLIESIAISGVATFREPVALGPLDPGLNILAQPNEWGKSTVIQALSRALFDKYSSQNEEIRQLRPAGTSLSPRIELCFAANGDRYRLIKTFLDGRSSELSRWSGTAWQRTDESDKADQRVRELLGAPPLEGRLAKAETWGLIRFLWCRQDDPAEWPCWEGDSGEVARRKLATVEIDTLMRDVFARLVALGEEHFTARGAIKKGSPLQLAAAEMEAAETELAALRQRRTDLEHLEAQYTAVLGEFPRLERERNERAAEAEGLRQQAEAAELLKREIGQAEAELRNADAALQAIRHDRDTLTRLAAEIAAEEMAQTESQRRAEETLATLAKLDEQAELTRAAARERERCRTERQGQLAQIRGLLQRRARAGELARLLITKLHLEKSERALQECDVRLAALPALSKSELKRGRELERTLTEQRAQLSVAGLAVRLEPNDAARVLPEIDGVALPALEIDAGGTGRLPAARSLTLDLSGWGRIIIDSGARETAEMQAELTQTITEINALFAQAGVSTLAEAETRAQEAHQWQVQREVARAEIAAHLAEWRTGAAFAAALARAQADRLPPEVSEGEERSDLSLQIEEQRLAAAEAADRKEEKGHAEASESLRGELERARRQAAETAQKIAGAAGRTKTLREQSAALAARHAGGIEPALAEAQTQFTRAEARLATARRELPAQAETLAERATRAARAAADLEAESRQKQREVDHLKTLLQERGGEGLYAREAEAEERLGSARTRRDSFRRAGLAARLLAELIQRREQESISAVLKPLEDRLTQTFAQLTGVAGRRVWFDEHLAIKGVGARPEELVPFDHQSRGAREQLLLALRAAIALEVTATEGPQCLVLDDVLVHTDARRHENVLDFLQQLSSKVQILLLTCHAERYRGLGHVVPVQRGAEG